MTGLSLFLGPTSDKSTPVGQFESSSCNRQCWLEPSKYPKNAQSSLLFGSRADRKPYDNQAVQKATGFHDLSVQTNREKVYIFDIFHAKYAIMIMLW